MGHNNKCQLKLSEKVSLEKVSRAKKRGKGGLWSFYIWVASPSFGSGTAPNLGSATCSRRLDCLVFSLPEVAL